MDGYYEAMEKWAEKARKDYTEAKDLERLEHYETAAFLYQQAAEKALKAVMIARGKGLQRTHECGRIARLLDAPTDIIIKASSLTEYYTETRYPDDNGGISEEEAKTARDRVEAIFEWTEKQQNKHSET